jgi:hypothetical protein
MAGRAGHAAARVRARSAQIEARQRHAVVGGADHRPGAEQLVEAHLAVEDVAADQAEAALEVERRVDLPAEHRLARSRARGVDGGDDASAPSRAPRPSCAPGKIVAEMLAEQATRHACPWAQGPGRASRDQHLDDRLLGPAVALRVEIRAVHVGEARRDDDARGQVIAALRQHGELGQLGQRDVHPEGRAFALPVRHALLDVGLTAPLRHSVEQQLGIDAGDDAARRATPCRRRRRRPRGLSRRSLPRPAC